MPPTADPASVVRNHDRSAQSPDRFEVTARGTPLARELAGPPAADAVPADTRNKPSWDADRRQLSGRGLLVKWFRRPAPNQWLVLAAFQEDGWPPRIDDPLPPSAGKDRSARMRQAVEGLNGCQANPLIRFLSDGTGTGILWEWADANDK